MTNKIRFTLAALALAFAGTANAGFTKFTDWGTISGNDKETVANTFHHEMAFSDAYKFDLTTGVDSFGGVVDFDLSPALHIDLHSVSLYFGELLVSSDTSPFSFEFSNLVAGTYYFVVNGFVNDQSNDFNAFSGRGVDLGVSYLGSVNFAKPQHPVSEPGTFGLASLGLLGLAFGMRRRLFS